MSESIELELRIRRAVPEDASAVASVLYASFAEYETSYTPEAFSFTVATPELGLHLVERFAGKAGRERIRRQMDYSG